jgi:hypothetical protein
MPRTNFRMKITRQFRLCFAVAILGWSPAVFGQVTPPSTFTAVPAPDRSANTIPALKVRSGPLAAAVDELSRALEAARLPEMNVIYSPEARSIQVPDLVLRNVSGPDALRLITVSAGCEMEPIVGADGVPIGFRVFSQAQGQDPFGNPVVLNPPAPTGLPQPVPAIPGLPPLPGNPVPGAAAPAIPGVMGFGGVGIMPGNTNSVRVYSLGGITSTTKFTEVEATLRDVLKADNVSADAAKLAFHERTNVLVVTADSRVHDLVTQFLDALQKNVAAAATEERRGLSERREALEAMVRMDAERNERDRVTKQLEQTEAALRDAQRELDRLKSAGPKGQ